MNLKQARITSFIFVMGGILLLLPLNLLTCFMAGFLVYEIVNILTPHFQKVIGDKRARWLVVAVISTLVVSLLTTIIGTIVGYLMQDMKNISGINTRIAFILQDVQQEVAKYLPGYLPLSVVELKNEILSRLQQHLVLLQTMGKSILHGLVTMLIGMVLGAIVSLCSIDSTGDRPLLKS